MLISGRLCRWPSYLRSGRSRLLADLDRRAACGGNGIAPVAALEAGDAEHHVPAVHGVGEDLVGARGRAVGLDEQQVDADRGRLGGGDAPDQLGDDGARPWPLALAGRASASSISTITAGALARLARHQPLVGVEGRVAQRRERQRLEADQHAADEKQTRADRARGAEAQSSISRPSCAAEISSRRGGWKLSRVSSSSRRASREQAVDGGVAVRRLVVEEHQVLRPRHLAELDADHVARVAPVGA